MNGNQLIKEKCIPIHFRKMKKKKKRKRNLLFPLL